MRGRTRIRRKAAERGIMKGNRKDNGISKKEIE